MVSKVIAALSHKGGVGKSTVLSSVAYALRKETHWRVVYVDATADALGSDMLAPGCRVEFGTYTFLSGVDAIQMCTVEADNAAVDTLPPGPIPRGAQLRGDRLRDLVSLLAADYNIIFLDLPGTDEAHSDIIRAAIDVADIYFLVAEPATLNLLYNLKQRLPQSKPVVAVLNKHLDDAPGKHEISQIGTSKFGKFAYVIPLEGPVHNAVMRRELPAKLRGVKFVEAVDRIGADIQRLILDVRAPSK